MDVPLHHVAPLGQVLVVAKLDPALVALARRQSNTPSVGGAVMREPEIVVVLGRIYLHMIGKALEHEGKDRQRIRSLELGGSAGFLDIGFIGSEPRTVLGIAVYCGIASSGCSG